MSALAPSLPALVIARAESTPNLVATRSAAAGYWRESSWADVLRGVSTLANAMDTWGVAAGSVVVVATSSRREWPLAVVAAHARGAATITVAVDATPDVLTSIVATRQVALWVAEDEEQFDKARAAHVTSDTPILVIDPRGIPADALGVHTWAATVVAADESADAPSETLEGFRTLVTALDVDQPAAIVPSAVDEADGPVTVWTHRQLAESGRTTPTTGPGLVVGDEYLSFLPPAWTIEQFAVLVEAQSTGAVVNFGDRAGGVLADLTAIQPTVMQAPAEFWDALAADVRRRMADSSRMARSRFASVAASGRAPGRKSFAWFVMARPLLTRIGLRRVRRAITLGPVAIETSALFGSLGIALEPAIDYPVSADAAAPQEQPAS